MDGNFIDNDYKSIIDNADGLPEAPPAPGGKAASVLKGKYDRFRLRLKFSSGLDPGSVNTENALLTSGNRAVKASVEYDGKRRSIIISPKSKYLRNTLYVLRVSGSIMSEKGRSLRKNRVIAFEQNGETLNFYRDFDAGGPAYAPESLIVRTEQALPMLFAISSLVLVGSYFIGSKAGLILGAALVFLATAAAFLDSISDFGMSRREYAYGARLYNKGLFYEAIECFELSLHYNQNNRYAKKGLEAAINKCNQSEG